MQPRIRKYGHSCLISIRKQFKDEMHLIYSELEYLKNKEIELTQKCEKVELLEKKHQQEMIEIKSYAQWDEQSHL